MDVVIESDIKQVYINKIVIGDRKRIAKNYESLKQSINEIGLMNPILLTTDLRLIAGAHRIAAYKELGHKTIPARIVEIDELRAELAEIDENIVRNQLTELEESIQLARRKEIYEALYPETKHGKNLFTGNQYTKVETCQNGDSPPERFTENTAKQTGRKERTIQRKVQIGSTLSSMADEIQGSAIEDSQKDLIALAQISKKSGEDVAKEVLGIVKESNSGSANGTKITDSKVTVKTALREYNRRQQSEEAKDIEVTSDLIDMRLGDFMDCLSDVPDGSIDLIITDPPYPHEYISEWSKLSAFASRVLKPGGFCIAYSGEMHMPEVMQKMREQLDYYWTFVLLQSGYSQFVTPRNLYCLWKPILVFQNGFSLYKPDKTPFSDVIDGSGKAKFSHVWQQGEDELNGLIEYFSNVGDVVCDPFAGSGTTLLKAAKMKRKAIGCEIDETHYNNAKKRIQDGLQ